MIVDLVTILVVVCHPFHLFITIVCISGKFFLSELKFKINCILGA